jgi:hypothetical protein
MAKSSRYRTHRGYVAAVKRGLKSGKYRTSCKKITRDYCYTKRGKPVRCGLYGAQYKKPLRRTFYRCVDGVTKRFAPERFCHCPRRKGR